MMRRPNQQAAKGAALARKITDDAIREQKRRTRPAKAYSQTQWNPGSVPRGESVDLDAHRAEVTAVSTLEARMPTMADAVKIPQPRISTSIRDGWTTNPVPAKLPQDQGPLLGRDFSRRT